MKLNPAKTLPEALAHGHTLRKATIHTDENFCAECGSWFVQATKKDKEPPKTWHDDYYGNH